jgi:hypothetical protein
MLVASAENVSAQSLLDFLKGRSTETPVQTAPSAEKINKDALMGVWTYSGVAVEFTGTDLISMLGSSVAAPTIKQSLEAYFAQGGIVRGSCSVEFSSDGTYIAKTAHHSLAGLYEFNHQNQTISITYDHPALGGKNTMVGKLTFTGQKLTLTFEAGKIVALSRLITKDKQLDQSINDLLSMISEYKGLYLGVELEK